MLCFITITAEQMKQKTDYDLRRTIPVAGCKDDCPTNGVFTLLLNCCCVPLLPFCMADFTGGGGWLRLGVVGIPCCCWEEAAANGWLDWLPDDCCCCAVWLKLAAKLLNGGGSLALGL